MKATLEFNLPNDNEEYIIASKSMDWALLVWDVDQLIRSLLKYDPSKFKTSEQALEHLRKKIHNLMEEKGLQFPA